MPKKKKIPKPVAFKDETVVQSTSVTVVPQKQETLEKLGTIPILRAPLVDGKILATPRPTWPSMSRLDGKNLSFVSGFLGSPSTSSVRKHTVPSKTVQKLKYLDGIALGGTGLVGETAFDFLFLTSRPRAVHSRLIGFGSVASQISDPSQSSMVQDQSISKEAAEELKIDEKKLSDAIKSCTFRNELAQMVDSLEEDTLQPMPIDETLELMLNIQKITLDKIEGVIQIIEFCEPNEGIFDPNKSFGDLKKLKSKTKRALQKYVASCLKDENL